MPENLEITLSSELREQVEFCVAFTGEDAAMVIAGGLILFTAAMVDPIKAHRHKESGRWCVTVAEGQSPE